MDESPHEILPCSLTLTNPYWHEDLAPEGYMYWLVRKHSSFSNMGIH